MAAWWRLAAHPDFFLARARDYRMHPRLLILILGKPQRARACVYTLFFFTMRIGSEIEIAFFVSFLGVQTARAGPVNDLFSEKYDEGEEEKCLICIYIPKSKTTCGWARIVGGIKTARRCDIQI